MGNTNRLPWLNPEPTARATDAERDSVWNLVDPTELGVTLIGNIDLPLVMNSAQATAWNSLGKKYGFNPWWKLGNHLFYASMNEKGEIWAGPEIANV